MQHVLLVRVQRRYAAGGPTQPPVEAEVLFQFMPAVR